MVANRSPRRGGLETRSPEVVLSSSKAGCHFNSVTSHSSRDKGVAGSKSNLKCQRLVRMISGMADSRAVSMGKRNHVPGRSEDLSSGSEAAGVSLQWGKLPFLGS